MSMFGQSSDDKSKVVPIRPIPGQNPACPPHQPHPIHQQWTVQEPDKLIPTTLRIQLCTKCHLLYWIELESDDDTSKGAA